MRIAHFPVASSAIVLLGRNRLPDRHRRTPRLGYNHRARVDFADFVYVADRGNYRVQKFNTSGQFQSPVDVATDSAGDVYVLDAERGRVQRFGER